MKKIWLGAIGIALIMALTACGSVQKVDSTEKEPAKEEEQPAEDDIGYEEFNRFGLFYELPEGTEETQGDDSAAYQYICDDHIMSAKAFKKDTPLTEDAVKEFAQGILEGPVEVTAVDTPVGTGYQFPVLYNNLELTGTMVEAPQYYVLFMVGKKGATDKAEYQDVIDHLLNSIRADDSVEAVEAEEPDYYVKGNTAVTEECTIKITKFKVFNPGEGANTYGKDPIIAIWYDMTNTSGAEISPMVQWPSTVRVIQDNDPDTVNKLDVSIGYSDSSEDDKMADIKVGGTAHCMTAYDLTDLTTPVQLVINNGLAGEQLGTITLKIK